MSRFNPQGFTSVKGSSGNIIAAQQAVKDAVNLHKMNAEAAPDLSMLAKTDMVNRANERMAVTKAETEVVKQGLKSVAHVTHKKMEKDMNEEIRGIRADAGRFAGMLGLVGTLAEGAGALASLGGDKKLRDKALAAQEKADAEITANGQKLIDSMNERANEAANLPGFDWDGGSPAPEMPTYENGGLTRADAGADPTPAPFSPGSAPTSPAVSGKAGEVTGGGAITTNGKRFSKAQLEQLAIQGGFTASQAPLVARIAMGESGGDPMAYNGKGNDDSYGLMQINMLGAMGPERRKQFGLTSNKQLHDPLTNMKAAKAIFDSQGWGAWGAYTNGSYLRH